MMICTRVATAPIAPPIAESSHKTGRRVVGSPHDFQEPTITHPAQSFVLSKAACR